MARCQHSVYILCYHTRQLGIQRQNLLLLMLLSASLNMSERLEHAVAIYQCMCDLHRKCCLCRLQISFRSLYPVPFSSCLFLSLCRLRTQKQNIDIFTSSSFITIHCERNRHKINKSFTRPEPPKIELAVCAFVCAKATLEIAAITRRRHSSLCLIIWMYYIIGLFRVYVYECHSQSMKRQSKPTTQPEWAMERRQSQQNASIMFAFVAYAFLDIRRALSQFSEPRPLENRTQRWLYLLNCRCWLYARKIYLINSNINGTQSAHFSNTCKHKIWMLCHSKPKDTFCEDIWILLIARACENC